MTTIEKFCVFGLLAIGELVVLTMVAAAASGQGIDGIAAAPGPTHQPPTAPAPVSADQLQKLIDTNAAFKEGFAAGVASATLGKPKASNSTLTATQLSETNKRLDDLRTTIDELRPHIMRLAEARGLTDTAEYRALVAQEQRNGGRTPTEAPLAAKDHVCDCGPNCRCVGQCNCRWPGECLGVPDTRTQRSVVTQPTKTVRYYSIPSRSYYSEPVSGGCTGGFGGSYSSGYYSPSYGGGYSSGTPVQCFDQWGNPTSCN